VNVINLFRFDNKRAKFLRGNCAKRKENFRAERSRERCAKFHFDLAIVCDGSQSGLTRSEIFVAQRICSSIQARAIENLFASMKQKITRR
jgi:hypothetical protein